MVFKSFMNFAGRLWDDRRGQDLIEYALMAGFVAVAAGAIMPFISEVVANIFQKVGMMAGVVAPVATPSDGGAGTVRLVCAVIAALFLGLIIARRKRDAE